MSHMVDGMFLLWDFCLQYVRYRSARITMCAAVKIDSTPPYSLNAWAELAQIFGGSPSRRYFQDHRGGF